ncbi:hypothetical protein [Acinetobacter pseudolwoffii]|jgi:hypothetical protein|uniref:hypothetical protein n=1 Tax=Acinetobacter pseudolwoffii TaxID=2053287 RepID=UPI003989AA90
MPKCNSKDLDFLLDVSSVIGKDFTTRLQHFERKAEILGFIKTEIESHDTKSPNPHIQNMSFGAGSSTSFFGVYFFYLTNQSTLNGGDWVAFKESKKISPWNTNVIKSENILYIGQRHESLKSRLADHTVKANLNTQALKLYEENCPPFSYSVSVYYQSKNKGTKATSKIYCLVLETIAKELFPTLVGK